MRLKFLQKIWQFPPLAAVFTVINFADSSRILQLSKEKSINYFCENGSYRLKHTYLSFPFIIHLRKIQISHFNAKVGQDIRWMLAKGGTVPSGTDLISLPHIPSSPKVWNQTTLQRFVRTLKKELNKWSAIKPRMWVEANLLHFASPLATFISMVLILAAFILL